MKLVKTIEINNKTYEIFYSGISYKCPSLGIYGEKSELTCINSIGRVRTTKQRNTLLIGVNMREILNVETGEILKMSTSDTLKEINRDRSNEWTDYNETDFKEGLEHFTEFTYLKEID